MRAELYHLQINVKDPKVSFPFYKELFSYLGYKISQEGADYIGFTNNINDFWLIGTESKYQDNKFHRKNTGLNHIAFKVDSKEKVDEFYNDFLVKNKIAVLYDSPKLFPEYSKDYYAVYFEDPDRIKIEVMSDSGRFTLGLNKDFFGWHRKKMEINQRKIIPDFAQQDIWWCSLGVNIGFEEDGKNEDFERPVLILKKFSRDVFIGLPLTSTKKESSYYFPCKLHDQEGSILLSHPRLLSANRLNRRLMKMGRGLFKEITIKYLGLFT